MNTDIPFDSNDTITVLKLNQEEIRIIWNTTIMYLEDNLSSNHLKLILEYLKTTPTQWDKIVNFILKIGIEKTIFLIQNIERVMLKQLLTYVQADNLWKVFNQYTEKEIVTCINEYHYYSVSIERKNHILIKSLNKWSLPNIIEKLKNVIFEIREKINKLFNK